MAMTVEVARANPLASRAMSKRTVKTPADRPYHKGNVAEDLLTAATAMMRVEPFENITLRRLSRDVGISPRNFYNHFDSLDDLLLTLGARGLDRRTALIRKIIAEEKTRKAAVVRITVEFVEEAVREPQLFRLMLGQIANGSQHRLMGASTLASFRALVEAVYGEDKYRREDLAWSHKHCEAAYAIFSLEYGLARNFVERHIRPQPNTPEARKRMVESIVGSFVEGTSGDVFKVDGN